MTTPEFEKARNIQSIVGSLINAPASGLVAISGMERESTQGAVRKMEIQIIELSDALAATVKELDRRTAIFEGNDRKLQQALHSVEQLAARRR